MAHNWRVRLLGITALLGGLFLGSFAPAQEPAKKEDKKADTGDGLDVHKAMENYRREVEKAQAEMRRAMEQARKELDRAMEQARETMQKQGQPFPGFRGPFAGRPMGRGRLGLFVRPVDDTLAAQLGLKEGQGLVVERVLPETPAAKAGFQEHDVLVTFHGKAVSGQLSELEQAVAGVTKDMAVDAEVMRGGKRQTIKGIRLGESGAPQAPKPAPTVSRLERPA